MILLALGTGSAWAASPAYCSLYAREYTAQFATGSSADAAAASEYRIQEQTYYQCLNLDVEPEFPESSVYAGASVEDVLAGFSGPIEATGEGDTSAGEADVPVVDEPAAKPKPTRTASSGTVRRGGTGLKQFTPEWVAWCKDHFPNSFDEATGYVKPFGQSSRLCPG